MAKKIEGFSEISKIPNVVAAIDGSHMPIKKPIINHEERVADDEQILTELTLGVEGTVIRPLVVGDSAYPLKSWLLPVIKNNGALTREKKKFNKELSKARIVVEHAFGLTKGRWRVLLKRLDEEKERVPNTIIACCILHNICVMIGDEYEADLDDDDDDDDNDDDDRNIMATTSARDTLEAVIEHVANL